MKRNTEIKLMVCPCCGSSRPTEAEVCPTCQARVVGDPLLPPHIKLPELGPALVALLTAVVILVVFLATWLLSNDMKVARVLLVLVLGESTTFTKSLLQLDPGLLQYRIYSFDAYRLACILSFGAVPLSLLGLWLARRALKLMQHDPLQFGGRRMALTALTLSFLWFVVFSAAGISSIPRAVQRGRAKHLAAMRAEFYRLHNEALNRYYTEFETYPQELSDLRDFVPEVIPVTDYWGNAIKYSPTALIASKTSTPGYSTYQLVSAGPDGVMETSDDIRMIDGVIVDAPENDDWFSSFFTPTSNEKTNDR
ncbi:MAG TPA: hypothetical protein VFZ34_21190 [Blastocatellia bacterium]|nr:hypothetical protein [Blastocatellia bacterium]